MDEKKPMRRENPAPGPARERAAAVALAICRLCQRPRVLRDSHFMPAAFYYHLGLDEAGTFQQPGTAEAHALSLCASPWSGQKTPALRRMRTAPQR
jgi:hypothetical protein